jgi:hypothetical protein
MKTVAKKFLTHRKISAQEAVYRLLSLPLVQGSREIVFVPTDLPENRTRLFKPLKLLETLGDNDTDVLMVNIFLFIIIPFLNIYLKIPCNYGQTSFPSF